MGSEEKTYEFALKVISLVDKMPNSITTQVVGRQLLKAATSVGANIVEAQAGSSRKDFANFFNHSLKSANETKYWLRLLKDSKKADAESITALIKEADEISNILGSSILTLKNKRPSMSPKGTNFEL